jgi:hypothetical protein
LTYLAKLEHQPAVDDAVKAMNDGIRSNDNRRRTLGRSEIAHEVNERLAKTNFYEQGGKFSEVTQRLMTLSFLDKLFSPAFNIVNSLQPAMVTLPTLAGRYGVGRSFDAIGRAYRDISILDVVGKGIKDTIAKARDTNAETTNFLDEIKALLSPKERQMPDYLAERGAIDRESGMEVAQLIKAKSGVIGSWILGWATWRALPARCPSHRKR